MTKLQQELELQKQLASRTSKRLKGLREGTGFKVVVESGNERGYAFTKVGVEKSSAIGRLLTIKKRVL